MHYTQNDKIRQATEGTIVVGVDIGSEKNYARAFKGNGIEIIRKAFFFPNTLEGFKSFEEMVTKLTVPLAEKKIVVGVEPTGHYWFNFADYCMDKTMTVVTVAPQHVKHSKEMDDNTQRKDDRKDPRVIAKLVIEGRYCIPYRPKGVYAELRAAYNRRCEIVEAETRAKNRIRRWFDLYFPEYRTVYGSVAAITGMTILKQAPLPQDIVSLGMGGILQIWRANKLRAAGLKRAKTLFEAAQRSICPPDAGRAVRMQLWQLLEEYEYIKKQLNEANIMIGIVTADIPEVNELMKIPGIGLITAAGMISEIGDIRRFDDPRQIQKLAGLAIVVNESGKHKGQSEISRRGRNRLRKILFQAALVLVRSNKEFKSIHDYFTTREKNPLKKKQSLMAVAAKLIRVCFGMVKNGTPYDPTKVLKDIRRVEPKAA